MGEEGAGEHGLRTSSVPTVGAIAYSPSIANGLSLTARDYAAPDPHGPRVDGRDLFRAATQRALAAGGVRVHWVESFAWSHLRDTSGGVPWWSTGAGR